MWLRFLVELGVVCVFRALDSCNTELRRAMYSLFSQYGAILDVVAQKTLKMRGQAFIAFRVSLIYITFIACANES